MALSVPKSPALPRPPQGGDIAGVYTHLAQLNRALFQSLASIGLRLNGALPKDGTEVLGAPITLASYTVASLPDASLYTGALIYVSNETGGATIAFSDGTNWRRAQDRVIVS